MTKRNNVFPEKKLEELFGETDHSPATELLPLSKNSKKKSLNKMSLSQTKIMGIR